jgi:hypothetical protein
MKVQFEPVNIICGIQSDIPDYQFPDNSDSIIKDIYEYWLKEKIVYNKKERLNLVVAPFQLLERYGIPIINDSSVLIAKPTITSVFVVRPFDNPRNIIHFGTKKDAIMIDMNLEYFLNYSMTPTSVTTDSLGTRRIHYSIPVNEIFNPDYTESLSIDIPVDNFSYDIILKNKEGLDSLINSITKGEYAY